MDFKISVALCTYNGSAHIEQQLDSILCQTILPDEIIICDDQSTDDTVEKVKRKLSKASLHWEITVNKDNLGVVKNFEKAIAQCKGDIIFTADQDDVWLKEKIERIIHMFQVNENLKVVFTDAYLVDNQLNKTGVKLWDTVYPGIANLQSRKDFLRIIVKNNIITGTTMAFRRSLVDRIMPFSEHWLHDYWLGITGTLIGEVKAINEPLVLYRQHELNVIGATRKSYIEKIKLYIKNFKRLDEIRTDRNNKFASLVYFISKFDERVINSDDKTLIEQGSAFWARLHSMNSMSRRESIMVIICEYFRGNYKRYYTGYRGAIRDLISVCINSKK